MKHSICAVLLALGALAAQAQAPAGPTASGVVGQAPAALGVQGQNIFDVKPDASAEPGYAEQTNGERMKVQPGNNAPMWRQVGQGVTGYSSLPKTQAPEAGNLIQPFVQYPGSRVTNAGEAWRQVRNQWIIPYGAALFAIVLLALGIFYFTKGPLGHDHPEGPGTRRIERFTPFERAAHWANAFAFIALAISGIVMAFGKFFLLPIMGSTLFGWLTYALKNVHNFVGPLFAVSLLVIILTFVKDNIANRADFVWLSKGGGRLGVLGRLAVVRRHAVLRLAELVVVYLARPGSLGSRFGGLFSCFRRGGRQLGQRHRTQNTGAQRQQGRSEDLLHGALPHTCAGWPAVVAAASP